MGAELVEGIDLTVGDDGRVYMRTIDGLERVDDLSPTIFFLDPRCSGPDSLIGVPGLDAGLAEGQCHRHRQTLPELVSRRRQGRACRLGARHHPLLPRGELIIANVPTWRCMYDDERRHVLDNLRERVGKPANESGGYGILIGDWATDEQLAGIPRGHRSGPRNWVAQPILDLSTVPTVIDGTLAPRHVDLRPFILTRGIGPGESYVTPGGLTWVALPEGSLVVNSSQGGGSKDTWIVDLPEGAR